MTDVLSIVGVVYVAGFLYSKVVQGYDTKTALTWFMKFKG